MQWQIKYNHLSMWNNHLGQIAVVNVINLLELHSYFYQLLSYYLDLYSVVSLI